MGMERAAASDIRSHRPTDDFWLKPELLSCSKIHHMMQDVVSGSPSIMQIKIGIGCGFPIPLSPRVRKPCRLWPSNIRIAVGDDKDWSADYLKPVLSRAHPVQEL